MSRVVLTKTNLGYIPAYQLMTQIVQEADGSRKVIKSPLHHSAADHVAGLKRGAELAVRLLRGVDAVTCEQVGDAVQYDFVQGESWLSMLMRASKCGKAVYLGKWKAYADKITPGKEWIVPFMTSASFEKLFGRRTAFAGMPSYPAFPLDLTPANLIHTPEGKDVAVDCEWVVDGALPLDLLMYHVVHVTVMNHGQFRDAASEEEVLEYLGVTGNIQELQQAWAHFADHITLSDGDGKPYELRYAKPMEEFEVIKDSARYHQELAGQLQHAVEELDGLAKARQENVEQLNGLVREQQQNICQLDGLAKARQENVEQLNVLVEEQRQSIDQLDEMARSQQTVIDGLNESLAHRQGMLDDLYNRLDRAYRDVQVSNDHLVRQHEQIQQLQSLQQEAEILVSQQQSQLQEVSDEFARKERKIHELEEWLSQVKDRIQYLEVRNQGLEMEIAAGRGREVALAAQRQAMEDSRSWRITAPLRKIKGWLSSPKG